MSHKPNAGDIAADLTRCVMYQDTNHVNFIVFYNKARKDWNLVKKNIDSKTKKYTERSFQGFKDTSKLINKRLEDLYNASIILRNYHLHSLKMVK